MHSVMLSPLDGIETRLSPYVGDDFQHLCVRERDGALRSHGPFAHANDARVPWIAGEAGAPPGALFGFEP